MSHCPYCQAELSTAERASGTCPHCQRSLSAAATIQDAPAAPDSPAPSTGKATVVEASIGKTIDAESLAELTRPAAEHTDSPAADSPATESASSEPPPRSPAARTVQDRPITGTIDAETIAGIADQATTPPADTPPADTTPTDNAAPTPAGAATVDDSQVAADSADINATVDSVDLNDGPTEPERGEAEHGGAPASDGGERHFAETLVDASLLEVARSLDATPAESTERPGERARRPGTATIQGIQIARTVDGEALDDFGPLGGGAPPNHLGIPESDSPASGGARGTVDASCAPDGAPAAPGGKPGTVADAIGRTIDSPVVDQPTPAAPAAPGGATIDARGPMVTIDSSQTPQESDDRSSPPPTGKTISSTGARDVQPHVARTLAESQAAAAPPAARDKPPAADEPGTSTLFIQRRALRDVSASTAGPTADYDLLKKLGEGGMGVVYAARQASIDRTVALKMLKPSMDAKPESSNKFLSEAVITGELEHPNIVPIYDVGKNEANALFYAMKRVQGTPWDEVIGQKSLSENVDILMRVCDAIAFAHSRGVVHRDLKPENTMLGDYGEVLVMDWGLALPFGEQQKPRAVSVRAGMGGTPAYMAPEMATGPFDKAGPASDIYLLGAILYEIITGRPPHEGRDVMKCLFAAAKNEIVPTEKSGELLDIARKAMATKPADRYASVLDLQHAIRTYLEHSESIATAARAEDELRRATAANDYESFSRAVFGFHEALAQWDGNERARSGEFEAKLAYAACALQRDDLDLAWSLLDRDREAHAELVQQVQAAIEEREAKKGRLKNARRTVVGLAATVFLVVCGALYVTDGLRKQAERSAVAEAKAKQDALMAAAAEAAAKEEALRSADAEKDAKLLAQQKQEEAERAAAAEVIARQAAEDAQREAEYEEYVALIGLAAASMEENAFGNAREVLERCKPELRNWEWRRLMHLCTQSVDDFDTYARINDLDFAPDGRRFVTAGTNGAEVWELGDDQKPRVQIAPGEVFDAVAWSPAADLIATGGDRAGEYLRLWDPRTGEPVATLAGHEGPVVSVAFSRDGARLLTTSMDNTARLWDVASRSVLGCFREHGWLVWDAAFGPDEQFVVTAGHDGSARIWSLAARNGGSPAAGSTPRDATSEAGDGDWIGAGDEADVAASQRAYFDVHEGPVYAVAVSPVEDLVVTGGYDKQLLVWRPSELKPFDYDALLAGQSPAPPQYERLGEHAAAVRCLAFSRDGRLLLSSGHDNTVKLWDVASRQLLKSFRGHDSWVRACAFSPDEKWVLSAGFDEHAKLWNVEGYEEVRVLQGRVFAGHTDAVLSAAFSRDGRRVVTASRDRTARSFDVTTGRDLASFVDGHAFLASTAAYFDDGKRLLTAAADESVRIWNNDGVELVRLTDTGIAAAAVVSHDGRWVATGSSRTLPADPMALDADDVLQRALLWEAATGDVVRELVGHRGEVTALAFSPDDRFLFTGDSAGRGLLWDLQADLPPRRLGWHTSKITAAAFLPDGTKLLTASDDKTVCQWDTSGRDSQDAAITPVAELALKHPDTVWSLDVARDGRRVLTSCADGTARLWNVATARVEQTFQPSGGAVSFAALAPDGRYALAVDAERRSVHLWDVRSGEEILAPGRDGATGPCLDLTRLGGLVWTAIFAPDGRDIVTVGGDEARRWDVQSQTEVMRFSPHAAVASANFSPDGSRVVTAGWDHAAKVWDAGGGTPVQKLTGHTDQVTSASFSPVDGDLVLTASADGTARLWDVVTGDLRGPPLQHPTAVNSATFSRDGRWIVTACDDGVARIWQTETLDAEPIALRGHTGPVLSAVFSDDATRVATGSDDNSARIWDATTGEVLHVLRSHTAPVTSVAISPDGTRVLTASEDFTARLWDAGRGREVLNLKGHTQAVTSVRFSDSGRYALTASRDGTAVLWLAVESSASPDGA